MTMNKKNRISLLLYTVIIIFLAIIFTNTFKNKEPIIEFQPNNIYEETLIIAADKDFEPYSFFDENGVPTGHDIEMIYLLADEMEMNIEIRLMEWNDAIDAAINKDVDAILGFVYSPFKTEELYLSIPTCNDSFVVFGTEDYIGISELYDKKLAILKSSDINTLFIKPYQLLENTREYNTYGEAFASVENGYNDYIIATYSVGRRIATQYKNIKPLGTELVSNSFCIASDNAELVEQLNAMILEMKIDGTLDALSEKWLGKYIEIINISDFFKQHILFLLMFLCAIILIPLLSLTYVYRKRAILLKINETLLLGRVSQDYLTNVLNRNAAESTIGQILTEVQEGTQHALFMIDIDKFKSINDTYGHFFGDQVLITIAEHIKNVFSEDDIVARMGGDEFLVFVKDFKDIAILESNANELCTSLYKSKKIQDIPICISASIGISLYPQNGETFLELYKSADKALYRAKESGKNQYVICNISRI